MKTLISIPVVFILLFCNSLFGQPSDFSWAARHGKSYIKDPQDQKVPGPCHIFAAVAGVEAVVQIYFNNYVYGVQCLDLSESQLYNSDCGLGCGAGIAVPHALNLFLDLNPGVIDEYSLSYPETEPYCRSNCYTTYRYMVTIPHYSSLSIENNTDLSKAIIDYGPIIVTLPGTYDGRYAPYYMHDVGDDAAHSVLVVGWKSNPFKWYIKDSWPGHNVIDSFDIDLFKFEPQFYRVWPEYNNNSLDCDGDYCDNYFTMTTPVDNDKDGWYNWGFDDMKPSGWEGIGLMDFDDSNPNIGFMYDYGVYSPTISGPIYLCSEDEFILSNIPEDLQDSVSWSVTNCLPTSGSGCTAEITPLGYVGKNCKITYTFTYNGTITFEKNFVINGPREDLVSVSVLDSYGGSPPNYSDTYYICPNTTYTISYNNYDSGCTTSNFDWDLPYGWSTHWEYNNTISINTNDYPYGMLDIEAETECCGTVRVYTLYFVEGDCEEYFMIYPNPSEDLAYIDINKNKIDVDELSPDQEFTISVIDRSGITKYSFRFKEFPFELNTSSLPKGVYFVNLSYGDNKSTIRLYVEH